MEQNTAGLSEKYEEIKRMLLTRAASSLGEAGLKIFMSMLDGYHEELTSALKASAKAELDLKDENSMLLGLAGVNETGVLAKLASQSAELRFMRQETLDLRKELEESGKKIDGLNIEVERLKNELKISLGARESDQKGFDKRIEELSSAIKDYDGKIKESQARLDEKIGEAESRTSGISREVERLSEEAVKRAVIRLGNVCAEVNEASNGFREEIERAKTGQETAKKKTSFFGSKPGPEPSLAPVLPSFNLLMEKVEEAATILKKYMDTFSAPEIKPVKVNWNKLFDDLKNRFGSQVSSRKIKIVWPAGKMPADFVGDQALLHKAFSELIQNALEALPVEGTIETSAVFGRGTAEFVVKDSGKELKPEQIEMLFTPLYTTKSNHYGLGLVNCRRIARSLGGDAVYLPAGGGNAFKLTFSSRDAGNKA